MMSAVPGVAPEPGGGSAAAERRRRIARKWAYQVSLTAYLPMSHAELQRELLELVNRLFDAVTSEPLPADRVAEVGARLVDLHCVGKASLRCTVDVLAAALLTEPELQRFDRLPERIVRVLGALASGYAEGIRASTMEQQDNLHRALLESIWQSDRHLRTSEALLAEVLACAPSGIAITDLDGRVVRANAAFNRLLDSSPAEDGPATLFDLFGPREGLDLRDAYQDLLDGKLRRLALGQELRHRRGETTRVSLAASLLRDADGNPDNFVTIIAGDEQPHDPVTGLPDRERFTARLRQVLRGAGLATLYELELDGFPVLANGLGRQAGDGLLRTVARRLLALVAELDGAMVARFEGATFAILVESTPSAPDTVTMIKKIQQVLAEPVRIAGLRVPPSVSIGVVHQHSRDADPRDLVDAADLALRRATGKGCGQWAMFDPDRDDRDRETMRLAATMPGAWDVGQLRVGYRPVVRLAGEQVLAVEAVLRWDHPELGPLPHHRCQELAEHTGLILRLGDRLLSGACGRIRSDLSACVDLTANQAADRDLVGRVRQAIEETGAPPARLRIGMPVAELHRRRGAADNLNGLVGAGVALALHQFRGTPEDLGCLEDLPVRVVRLAPSLVRQQPGTGSLVGRAVPNLIELVHRAGATVTVDGIRTRAEADRWQRAGADAATGPLFGPGPR